MAVGTGYGFDVSELSKALDKLDAQLASIVAQGEAVQNNFKSLFNGKNIRWDVLDKVDKLQTALIDISKTKDPLSWDSTGLRGYIDDVNRLIRTINVLNGAAGFELFGVKDLEKVRTEFKKMLTEVETYEKQVAKSQTAQNQTYAGAMAFSSNAKSMEEERQAIVNLEAAREKLIKTDANYATQLNDINVAIEKHKNNIREAMKTDAQKAEESRKKAEATRKEAEAQRKANEEAYRSTTVGALGYSRNAKSLNEIRQAMKYLEAARSKEKLDTKESRENYRQLTDELARQTKTYEGLTGRVAEKQKGLLSISSQLGRQFATVFSISQITGYINKLAQVRGEFELQQRSLQAILQNKNEANEIWNKTTELAVKSPFRVKELTSYTKQLAAYRIESDKLYDTNKMLADVSAGLGVDMQRLILAYGQVRSAEYLRGTELRQFTEAGVPMLDELAKHLEKVKGRSFEVAEVFDMISKRMITFADVEQVFKNMTQAGGTFYNMQEIQSNTLRGQISNLKDSIDLMLNDIGKSTEGTMKNAVGAVKALVDNYEKLIPVLKTVIALMAVQGVQTLSMSRRMLALGRLSGVLLKNGARGYSVMQMLNIGVQTLTRSFIKGLTSVGKFVATNPWLLFGAVVIGTFSKIISENNKYRKSLEAIDKEHARVAQSLQAIGIGFDKSIDDKNYDDAKKQLTQLISLAEREYNLRFNIEVGKLDDEQVKKTFEDIERQLTTVGVKAADFSKALEQGFLVEDDFAKDLQDLNVSSSEAFQSMQSFAVSLAYNLQNAKDNGEALTKQQEDALKVIRDGKQENQSQLDYFESLRKAITTIVGDYERYAQEVVVSNGQNKKAVEGLEAITKRLKLLGINIDAIRPLFSLFGGFDKDVKEAQREFDYFIKRLETKDFASMSDEDLLATLTVAVDTEGANRKWNDFVKDHVKRWLEEVYPIKFKPVVDEDPDKTLLAWQESYNKLFEGKTGFEKIDKKATQHEKVIKRLNGEYEKQKDLVEQIAKAGTKGAYQGYNLEEERKKLQEINAQLAWFGVSPEDKGKDEVLEKLKNRISLIKEMNKEYEKLNKTFSKAESLAKVQKAYADTAKELGLDTSTMDFTDEGTIKSLEALLGKPEYAANKYVIELQKALDNFKVELGVEVKQEKDKDLEAQVQELFDEYDLALEIKKLNIPPELAKDLFGVNTRSLEELKEAVTDAFMGVEFYNERIKDAGKLMEDTFNGNVDLLNRKLIPAQELAAKGWKDVGDGLATVFSSSYSVTDASGKQVDILVTPILPDGTVMSEKELEEYISKNLEGAKDVLEADKKGIVIHAVADMDEGMGEYLHSLQEVFYASDMLSEDQKKKFKDFLDKIADMEDKAAKERMKTYSKYLLEGMSERVKLKIEEMRKLKEIEESDEFTTEQKERIKAGVSKEARAEQQKQEWKDFQGSDMYTMMFEDLEHYGSAAIDALYKKLSELKTSLSDLPASEVKEIVGQIEKLENIKIERNPFESLKTYKNEVKNIGFSEEELQNMLMGEVNIEKQAQNIIDVINIVQQSIADGGEEAKILQELTPEQLRSWEQAKNIQQQTGETLDGVVKRQERIIKKSKEHQTTIVGQQKAYKKLDKSQEAALKETEAWLNSVGDIFSASKELMGSLGVESDSVAMTIADTGSSMVSLILSAVQFTLQLQAMEVAANSALGIIGWIAIALQAVAMVISAIFSAKDKALQRQVEANLDTVKALQEKYETLEDSIDNAWDTASIQAYNQELKATTQSMIDAQKAAIAAQSKRKGANKEGSDAYNELQDMRQELDEMEKQLGESLAESFSKVTDGILDSVYDAAREFTDAWWDAFVETGDGLKGLEENFNEMFLNLAKNQAAMQITGAFADRWKKDLEKYINEDDTELTKDEAKKWAEEVRRTFPQLSDALEGYLGVFKDMASETQGAGLSALTKGIQGITADQAEILSSYWNSVRGYTASIDSKMDLILANMGVGAENNPMLEQLISQTSWLSKIHGILEDVASASPRTFKTSLT